MSEIFVVLERANRCRVAVLQVIPRPPWADALIVEPLIVADDAAVDALDASIAQRRDPFTDYLGGVALPRVDRRIAPATNKKVTPEHASFDNAGGLERGRETIVPA